MRKYFTERGVQCTCCVEHLQKPAVCLVGSFGSGYPIEFMDDVGQSGRVPQRWVGTGEEAHRVQSGLFRRGVAAS